MAEGVPDVPRDIAGDEQSGGFNMASTHTELFVLPIQLIIAILIILAGPGLLTGWGPSTN